jgi:hypothetical protein
VHMRTQIEERGQEGELDSSRSLHVGVVVTVSGNPKNKGGTRCLVPAVPASVALN